MTTTLNWLLPVLMPALYLLWACWLLQVAACAAQARRFRRCFNRGDRAKFHAFRPPTVLIVPFKGIDTGAVANIQSLFRQDHPDYRLVCVVEAEEDPVYPMLVQEAAKFPGVRCDVVVAGQSDPRTGQKVHNQRTALLHLERFRDGPRHPDEAWVFADSDAVPDAGWLGRMVGPLQKQDNAVVTGYRWLTPVRGTQTRFPWGSRLASVVNAGVASFMADRRLTFAWGGSMSMLARTADAGGLLSLWRHALSDDFQVSRMAMELGRRVYFVPSCLVESPIELELRGFFEFARRQYVITRVHAPALYAKAVAALSVWLTGWCTAIVAAGWGVATRTPQLWVPACAVLALVAVLDQLRAWIRRRMVLEVFRSGTYQRLKPALRLDQFGMPLVFMLNLLAMLSALSSKRITWRGRTYRLNGPQAIEEMRGAA